MCNRLKSRLNTVMNTIQYFFYDCTPASFQGPYHLSLALPIHSLTYIYISENISSVIRIEKFYKWEFRYISAKTKYAKKVQTHYLFKLWTKIYTFQCQKTHTESSLISMYNNLVKFVIFIYFVKVCTKIFFNAEYRYPINTERRNPINM